MEEFGQFILDWFLTCILWLPRFIFRNLADLVEYSMTKLPDLSGQIQTTFQGLPGDLVYFTTLFEVNYGLSVVFGALIARFALRRIPVIG